MKNALAFTCVILGITGCATTVATTTNSGAPVQTALFAQYDHIRGVTDVSTIVFIRTGGMFGHPVQLDLRAMHPDTVLRQPLADVYLLFQSESSTETQGWQFLRDHDLILLLDGSTRLTLPGVRESDVGTMFLKENIAFQIPTSDMLKVGNATKVEGRLGTWDFTLKPNEIEKFREMALFASLNPNAPRPKRGRDR